MHARSSFFCFFCVFRSLLLHYHDAHPLCTKHVVAEPGICVATLLKLGDVLAGRWGRSPHYNQNIGPDEPRNSFVMYGNSRILGYSLVWALALASS